MHALALELHLNPIGATQETERKLSEHEAWLPIERLRIPFEDKSFLLGFIHALQLNNNQTYDLLQRYADYWERAERYEPNPNRKRNAGRKTANQWITNGCIGFIKRI